MYKTIPLSLFLLSLTGSGMACEVVSGIKFTAYGFPDASGIPAYKCNGDSVATTGDSDRTQLGDGSFGSPYAAAAAGNSVFQKCELLYMPLLKKYFRVQDDCSACVAAQTDLYIAQSNQDIGQTSCEQQFGTFDIGTPLHEVIRSPGDGFEVLTAPLFDNDTKQCYSDPADGRVFPGRDGQVQCDASGNEVVTTAKVGGTADDTPAPSSPLDSDPAARHSGMKPIPSGSAKFRA